jgi:hypothetical protein
LNTYESALTYSFEAVKKWNCSPCPTLKRNNDFILLDESQELSTAEIGKGHGEVLEIKDIRE